MRKILFASLAILGICAGAALMTVPVSAATTSGHPTTQYNQEGADGNG